jgi:hypothetical protein
VLVGDVMGPAELTDRTRILDLRYCLMMIIQSRRSHRSSGRETPAASLNLLNTVGMHSMTGLEAGPGGE